MLLVLAGVMVGASVALLVYRFAMLGLFWKGVAKHVLTGLAVGLGIGARAIANQQGGPKALPMLAGAPVGAAIAFGLAYVTLPTLGNARLEPRELPGFTISLPPGTDAAPGAPLDYAAGKMTLKDVAGTNSVLAIGWEPGDASREELELLAPALAAQLGSTQPPTYAQHVGPVGQQLPTAVVAGDKGTLRMTYIPCGARRLVLMTIGDDAMAEVHGRVLPTIVCRPDAAREPSEPGVVNVHLELPGWQASERGPALITLTDGTAFLTLRQLASGTPQDLPKVVPSLFAAVGGKITVGAGTGDHHPLSGTIEGEHVEGWVRELVCPRGNVLLMLLASDRARADAVATQTANARCLRTGEAAPVWPDAPAPAIE